jgi:spore coat protein A
MYTTTNGVVTGNQLNYTGPIPAVPHLHGGEVPPWIDGGPDAWFLSNSAGWGAGYPGAWDTYTKTGPGYYTKNATDPYYTAVYRYPNVQPAAPIWFHDHLLGGTRLNVYAGIAGAYLIVDPSDSTPPNLQPVNEIVPVVIQDRMFDTNGELFFPSVGINPTLHPFWIPEFVGDTIAVNGKVWPFLNVESKRYRFLFLNGSNARAYELFLTSQGTGMKAPVMWQISTDGGYLDFPVAIDPNAKVLNKLILMPGERAGVIIDFAGFKAGDTLILANTARTPYPGGAPVSGRTTGRVMQFKVTGPPASPDTSYNPNPAVTGGGGPLRSGDPIRRLVNTATGALGVTPNKVRQLTLNEVMAPGGPYEVLVNNTKWNGKRATAMGSPVEIVSGGISDGIGNYYTENPNEGDVEVWEIINMTADAHPIHTHLTQFQLVNRQNFDLKGYSAMYNGAFPNTGTPYFDPMTSTFMAFPAGAFIPAFGSPYNYDNSNNPDYATPPTIPVVGGNPDVTPFLMGPVIPPAANEAGWKDTVQMYPGQVTRIAIPYRPINSAPNTNYAFNPGGADYVWHCHIIDHEDNEMMRPYQVTPAAVARTYIKGTDY